MECMSRAALGSWLHNLFKVAAPMPFKVAFAAGVHSLKLLKFFKDPGRLVR